MLPDHVYKLFRVISLTCSIIVIGAMIGVGYNTITNYGDMTYRVIGIIFMIIGFAFVAAGLFVRHANKP